MWLKFDPISTRLLGILFTGDAMCVARLLILQNRPNSILFLLEVSLCMRVCGGADARARPRPPLLVHRVTHAFGTAALKIPHHFIFAINNERTRSFGRLNATAPTFWRDGDVHTCEWRTRASMMANWIRFQESHFKKKTPFLSKSQEKKCKRQKSLV